MCTRELVVPAISSKSIGTHLSVEDLYQSNYIPVSCLTCACLAAFSCRLTGAKKCPRQTIKSLADESLVSFYSSSSVGL